MDITSEQESCSLMKESTSSHPADHVIPQMIITSADDISEEQKNISECTLVLIPPTTNNSIVSIENKITLEKSKKSQESSNAVKGGKPDFDFEDISTVVSDVISKCTETVSHSTVQRPLVIEVEKSTPKQEVGAQDTSMRCPTPPPPPPPVITSPTTKQRPLVFEGVISKPEVSLVPIIEKKDVDKTYEIQDELTPDVVVDGETIPESIKSSSPTKKDGLHGVKKFFDSLWHAEAQDNAAESKEIASVTVSDTPVNLTKSEKHDSKKIFHTSKSSSEKAKNEVIQLPELSSHHKESTSFAKDAKQSIKTFFDSFNKHEANESVDQNETQMKTQPDITKEGLPTSTESALPGHQKESKASTSFAKDTKQNIKAFFDNLKQEPSDEKFKSSKKLESDLNVDHKDLDVPLKSSETCREENKSPKDKKQSIKGFFDSFKLDTSQSKQKDHKEKTLENIKPSLEKDTAQKQIYKESLMAHEKDKELIVNAEDRKNIKPKELNMSLESSGITKEKEKSPKNRKPVKSFFDSFKHETKQGKQKDEKTKLSLEQESVQKQNTESTFKSPELSISVESSEISKEKEKPPEVQRQNIKSFFDSFKLETNQVKQKVHQEKMSELPPEKESVQIQSYDGNLRTHEQNTKSTFFAGDRNPLELSVPLETSEISKETDKSPKDKKQNLKSFFDSFKLETKQKDDRVKSSETKLPAEKESIPKQSCDESLNVHEKNKESTSFVKDTKQNIKAMFDTFRLDSSEPKPKETLKKSALSEPDLQKYDSSVSQHKDSNRPLKKFFSFKHIGDSRDSNVEPSSSVDVQIKKELVKPSKEAKSVKLNLNPTYSNGFDSKQKPDTYNYLNKGIEIKERAQSVPSDSLERARNANILSEELNKKVGVSSSILDSQDKQVEKDSLHGIKKFFESFKHDKADLERSVSVEYKTEKEKTQIVVDPSAANDGTKSVEKSGKDKKSKGIKRSFSDKVNREDVIQNFKGFFDSIGHKSSSKKPGKKEEHIYDTVEVKPELNIPVRSSSSCSQQLDKSASKEKERHTMTKPFDSFPSKSSSFETSTSSTDSSKKKVDRPISFGGKSDVHQFDFIKDSPQPSLITTKINIKSDTAAENDFSNKVNESANLKSDKSSLFSSIGDNILALKEKMLHNKEKRKSDIIDDSVKIPDVTVSISKDNTEKIQPPPTISISVDKENLAKYPAAEKSIPEKTKVFNEVSNVSPSSPDTLYDTCCMRIAVLLRDKAVEVVSKRTKSPPPKPPKPSAETIAKARAAAVSRRLEAQRLASSVGDNIPIGYDGIRFADDETESSCDYKDVENFDYIMDYELINRYKVDISKLDTFSVPSTSSGMTSYYTADTVTLRDENFSDAAMETVSLSSDISYNLKHYSPSVDVESRNISVKNARTGQATATSISKQSAVKKVPPPIPPKPLILQTLSKNKTSETKISQCVNGLSLSPRLQRNDHVATLKRPLMVADIKETQFSSLQHPKSKNCPQKPARSFNTVLKNESLKNISDVSSVTPSSKPTSEQKLPSLQHSPRVLAKPTSHKDSSPSSTKLEKRTKSPPRPPPPNLAKKPTPQRPPPPIKSLKDLDSEIKIEDKPTNLECDNSKNVLSTIEKLTDEEPAHTHIAPILENEQVLDTSKLSKFSEMDHNQSDVNISQENVPQVDFDLNKHNDTLNNNISINFVDSINNNCLINAQTSSEIPKPPPRGRRIRSRTVEIAPSERCVERVKRSQSLTEIDVEKRVTFLTADKPDSKSLYTTVNKEGKRLNIDKTATSSSPDLVSGRPLPPPPPPPRKFRSLERKKTKDSEEKITERVDKPSFETSSTLKAPARRRKTEKQRFLSLHVDHKSLIDFTSERASSVPTKPDRRAKSFSGEKYDINANISVCDSPHRSLDSSSADIPNINRPDSVSSNKSVSERKKSHSSWYDENETLNESWEIIESPVSPDFCNQIEGNPVAPVRRKSDTKKKSRQTSKFYVNMEEEQLPTLQKESEVDAHEGKSPVDQGASSIVHEATSPAIHTETSPLPLVDKETSPLPLDCSEKSVQTSLETLSQGIISHDDDESEDTDKLLDLAQTLQKELSTIINRHKIVDDSTEASSPSLSAAASEKNLDEGYKKLKKSSSTRSSTSEVWPLSSSDESDVEREENYNVNEIAMKKKQKKIFYIAQEIMSSEEVFVDALKLLNVDFKSAVEIASKQRNMSVIPDDTLSQILNHLPQLQHLNENLLMELKDRIENWDKSEKIADIIVKMGPFLKLYSWYIHDFESNVSLLEECKKKYPMFAQVIKDFEMSPRCKKLSLNHYMLKPIQRIPQYRLLLQEYLHHLTEDSKDYQDTVTALQIVSEVANHANDSMKLGDNAQKLISIQNSIMGHKEIVKPGRLFVKEGELMKLSRKGMQPRWFVLFNDLLLYLTPVQQGLYRVNHELPLTGMKVAIPIQQDYQNEFSIISVTRSFTLAARSPEERQEWIVALTKAIEENASKRSTFTNTRLHQKAHDKTSSEDEGAFVLGKKAPVWIPDARVTMCQLCTSEFTVTFRRHHCRACGKVVCSICSSHRISLPYLGNRIARVCDECHTHLGQGSSACTESGETDSDNQQIAVKPHLRTDNKHVKKNKRMLPSVLKEVCANDQGSTISGYLHKRIGKSWRRDWFVVKDKVLYEYKASEDVAALKSIPLLGYEIELFTENYENIDSSLLFQLTHPGQAPIMFYADSESATERWVSALRTATVLE